MRKIDAMITFLISLILVSTAQGAVRFEKVQYKEAEQSLQGWLVYQGNLPSKTKKPALIMLHDRMGISPYVKRKAEEVAQMGYIVFVADIYGESHQPKNTEQAIEISRKFKEGQREKLHLRNLAAFNKLKQFKFVDPNQISAIGYCFGGTAALEMGRQGLPLKSIVSVHGNLNTAQLDKASNIKAKILVLHGAIDPVVPASEVQNFFKEMNDGAVDYQFISYAKAVHAFTKKEAGLDNSERSAYNAVADQRATIAVKEFLKEIYP